MEILADQKLKGGGTQHDLGRRQFALQYAGLLHFLASHQRFFNNEVHLLLNQSLEFIFGAMRLRV